MISTIEYYHFGVMVNRFFYGFYEIIGFNVREI